jgi:exopolysaccharide biosynthesis polyprenyl glycosylphosphotransferase
MLGKRRVRWVLQLIGSDLVTLVVCFLLAYHLRVLLNRPLGRAAGPLGYYVWLLAVIVPLWLALVAAMGGYGVEWLSRSRAALAARVSAMGLVVLTALLFLFKEAQINRSLLVLFAGLSGPGLWLGRGLVQAWLRRRGRDGRWLRQVLVVGTDERAARLVKALERYPEAGWCVRGCISLEAEDPGPTDFGAPVIGCLQDLPSLLLEGDTVVDEVFFATSSDRLDQLADALEACEQLGVDTRVMTDFYRPAHARPFVEELLGLPFFGFSATLTRQWHLAVKRGMDIVVSLAVLAVTAPFLVAIGLLIRATSAGPVLFRQQRSGLHGRPFWMYKFRTMVEGAEDLRQQVSHLNQLTGPVFKAALDPRVTGPGRLLRRWSLDELPQLVNVLVGHMSLVGPRPLPVYESSQLKGAKRRRLAMRPGVTGLWQVSGRTAVDFEEWMRLDLTYVDGWSLWLDLKILARTLPAVLRGEGAH